jgi:hypothetical protein
MQAVTASRCEFTEIVPFGQMKLNLVGSYRSFPPAGPFIVPSNLLGTNLPPDYAFPVKSNHEISSSGRLGSLLCGFCLENRSCWSR